MAHFTLSKTVEWNCKLIIIIIALYSFQSFANSRMKAPEIDLLITNATIITAVDKATVEVITKHWVAIKNGRIVDVADTHQRPSARQVLNAEGQFLIAGLMDSHTHISTMPGLNRDAPNWQRMQQKFLQRQGANYLFYGVTQVIDLANTQSKIKQFESTNVAPMAFFCGAMPVFQGYNAEGISFNQLHQRRPYYIHLNTDPADDIALTALHSPKNVLTRMRDDGAICGKVFIEDGFGAATHLPIVGDDVLSTLIDEAGRLALPLVAHANATDMQRIAVDANVSILAHGLWNWLAESLSRGTQHLPPNVKGVLDDIIVKDIAYQPTLTVIRALRDVVDPDHLFHPSYNNVIPQWQRDWYLSEAGQWFANDMIKDWGGAPRDFIRARFDQILKRGERALAYFYQQGGTVLLASDTTPAPTFSAQPGIATFMELKHMHSAGIDLVGLLAAATLNNAKAFNLDNDFGSVETGKFANLLLLNSHPLVSVDAYDDINKVILQGQVMERYSLHVDSLKGQASLP